MADTMTECCGIKMADNTPGGQIQNNTETYNMATSLINKPFCEELKQAMLQRNETVAATQIQKFTTTETAYG